MKKHLMLTTALMAVLALAGCDDTSSSSVVPSTGGSSTGGDVTSSAEEFSFDFALLNQSIATAAAGNFTMTDEYDGSKDYWSATAQYNEYILSGMFDLPKSGGEVGVFEFTYDETSGDVVVGEEVGPTYEATSFQELNNFNYMPEISASTATVVSDNEIIIDGEAEVVFFYIGYYYDCADYYTSLETSLVLEADGSFSVTSSMDGDVYVELSFADFGTTTVEPAETFVANYVAPVE